MARFTTPPTSPTQPALGIECLHVEQALASAGYQAIAGIDEVGRGAWAGPVYAAAVVLPPACWLDRSILAGVTDSKLLSAARRERLAADILDVAPAAALGWAEAPVIDRVNILEATRQAMCAALAALSCVDTALATPDWLGALRLTAGVAEPDYVLIDALRLPNVALPQQAIVRGDRTCLCIAAASIVAKVARDAEMRRRGAGYPSFGFERNKGYGTKHHARTLIHLGLGPLHRRTFAPMKYLVGVRDFVAGVLPSGNDTRVTVEAPAMVAQPALPAGSEAPVAGPELAAIARPALPN